MSIARKVSSTRVLGASVEFVEQSLVKPLMLSTGAISVLTEARATVRVRVGGVEAVGRGSIYLSDLWAWPEPSLTHEQRDAELRRVCVEIARGLSSWLGDSSHPLELGMRLHNAVCEHHHVTNSAAIPALALAMAASPFDAAIHDAAGRALGASAFAFYDTAAPTPSVDHYFPSPGGAVAAIGRTLRPLNTPLCESPAWLIVGKNDDLERDVRPWVERRGYHHIKLKIMGKDAAADAERTRDVYRAAKNWIGVPITLSVDSNEGNPDAASVTEYLDRLQSADASAYNRLAYLEQPTGRDIRVHRFDWRAVAARKPVLLDEGLTSLDLLQEAEAQGWSGLALKTCKGHSFVLVAAAWARERKMKLSLQDLTNPGLAAIHAAWMAAMLPTINGVELNSPQFTPAANAAWLPRQAGLFEPGDGVHRVSATPPIGLGSDL